MLQKALFLPYKLRTYINIINLWLPAKAAIYIIAEVYVVRLEHLCV